MDIVLIAGLWLDAQVWDGVAGEIDARGHHPVPVRLPGQDDGNATATLADQLDAVLAAVDAAVAAARGPVLVAGHSAACSLAWLTADRRPDAVAAVALIGGFPTPDGDPYAPFFPIRDGAMSFPGFEPFAGPDTADLDEATRETMAAAAIPVPEGVATGVVHLTDARRFDVPVVLVCPEFDPDQARAWIAAGDVPELAKATRVSYVDIDSGHWPMITAPAELARLLVAATGAG
ncbi:alpha/beta fold hydrolase [Pseudonocardia sp. GCM10023141]|uniref:alpha/beta fold hydrolase n=1 Tax=Pseudonocardia sp. GCM10023141 TaxID=3252653 RepID=UPI0036137340